MEPFGIVVRRIVSKAELGDQTMTRLTATAAITALISLVAVGCSNDNITVSTAPDAAETSAPSTAPETATETTPAAAVELSASDLLSVAIESTVGRAARGQLRIEGDMADPGGTQAIDFETDAQGDTESSLADDPSAPQLTVRIVDGQTYVGFPGDMAAVMFPDFAGETAWFTVTGQNAEQFAIACASPLSQLRVQPGDCDPAGDLRGLAAVAAEATVVGDEEVRGVPAQRLRFTVSMADLPSATEARDGLGGDVGGMLEGSVPVDVWIDDDMLLRMLVVDLSPIFGGFADAFGGEDADIELPTWRSVVEYYDFDESISIEAPTPESLLGDFSQVQGLAG